MSKKIIVTGGAGYIGSHTVVALYEAGYEPIIVDNLSNSRADVVERIAKIVGQQAHLDIVDLADAATTADCFTRHSDAVGVIHFAALKAVGESVAKPTEYYRNNLDSLLNVLTQMQDHDIPSLIFSSSATVYGQPDTLPATESTPWQTAESPYGATKQMGETIIHDYIKAGSKPKAIALRYFNPIGAHKSALIGELPLGVPNNLMPYITQTAAGLRDQLSVFGSDYDTSDGTAIRDYIHVVDIAEAHVVAIDRLVGGKEADRFEVFNLGTGRGSTVLEVIQSFEKTSGQKLNYVLAPRRAGDVEAVYASTDKARDILGWQPRYDLDDMTRSAWAWQERL
jgi:UDP-glucose 4-epimerase